MKSILFCQNTYAFGILNPIKEELLKQGDTYLWYVPDELLPSFPYKNENHTTCIKAVLKFEPDSSFVPGNEIPHYLTGVKAQVFHGFAGEKKGHFRIRHYFDLYLTQGPYFTRHFEALKKRYQNFEVVETGWPKLDCYSSERQLYNNEKTDLLKSVQAKNLILYAPTFSPSLTSAPFLLEEIEKLPLSSDYLVLIKFHDLMAPEWINAYKELASRCNNIKFIEDHNIIKYLLMADLLVSDTSSVIYEFLLLDKPVISFKNIASDIYWDNQLDYNELLGRIKINLDKDPHRKERQFILDQYHPYSDGRSAERMVNAVKNYISRFGVPLKRKISILRKYKMLKTFGWN